MLRKPCRLQTDRRTDGQGESSIPPHPPPTSLGGGIMTQFTDAAQKHIYK